MKLVEEKGRFFWTAPTGPRGWVYLGPYLTAESAEQDKARIGGQMAWALEFAASKGFGA